MSVGVFIYYLLLLQLAMKENLYLVDIVRIQYIAICRYAICQRSRSNLVEKMHENFHAVI